MPGFARKLHKSAAANRSLVCIGLDPDPALMPIPDIAEFNRAIIDATSDLVCAYKPNFPFYEAQGLPGLRALERTVDHVRNVAPDAALIADCKRGDIGSTNAMYARALFDVWGFDAATVNAWGGADSMEPYLEYEDRGVIIWCRSSNPGAAEFQDIPTALQDGERVPLYELMALRAAEWNTRGNVGVVVGSTYPEELGSVRRRCPDMPILVPGIGAQGGDLEASLRQGLDRRAPNLIISSSRGITYASSDPADFAPAARSAAASLRDAIERVLAAEGREW